MTWERLLIALVSAAAGVGGVWLGYELKGGGTATLAVVLGPIAAAVCGTLGWRATAAGQRRRSRHRRQP
jgi:hypothetical protein